MEEVARLDGIQARRRLAEGYPLAEIYWLRIDKKEDVGDLRGKLTITDGCLTECVDFCCPDESRYESAKTKPKVGDRGSLEVKTPDIDVCCADEGRNKFAGGEWPVDARLTGPNRAISACQFFYIDLEFENEDPVQITDEYGICLPWVVWSFADYRTVYNKPQYTTISSRYGNVTMMYVVMNSAVEAYVEIFLRSEKAPAKIHGRIIAETPFGEILLFEKDASEDIKVWPEVSIPLSRRVISVPLDSKVIIRADVREYNSDLLAYKDSVQGRAELHPEQFKTTTASIEGADCEIELKVTWLPFNSNISKGIDVFMSSIRYAEASPPCTH